LVTYIHANPGKHGFVDDFRDWEWSSYGTLISDKATPLARTTVIDWFGDRDTFAVIHQQTSDQSKISEFIGDDHQKSIQLRLVQF